MSIASFKLMDFRSLDSLHAHTMNDDSMFKIDLKMYVIHNSKNAKK